MPLSATIACLVTFLFGVTFGWLWSAHGRRGAMERLAAELSSRSELLQMRESEVEKTQRALELERREREAAARTAAALQARLDAEREASGEKIAALLSFEKGLKESFASLAADALDGNARRLLDLSRTELDAQKQAASKELVEKQTSIANLLAPMNESLQRLATHSQQLEVQREGAYRAILVEVENIQRSHLDLRRETTQLVQALRAPKVRGNWGEMQLRRCVEYSGMVEYASFEVEKFVRGEDASVRPDLIVKLPNQRCIVVDAKTPLDAFLKASACEEEAPRQQWLTAHAGAVRKHLDALSSKAYWNRFRESPDFVVCFLPSEVLFSAALEQDPALLEYSAGSNVLLATPTTLIALLKAVAYGWQQAKIARDAELIRDAANNLHKKFVGLHASFLAIGSGLRRAGDAYDDALNKAEGHGGLFSIARKLRDLKIGEKDISDSMPVALRPRLMQHEDWQIGLSLAANQDADAEMDSAS